MITRRQLLKAGLVVATAVAFPGRRLLSQTAEKKALPTLALQTYTLRQFGFGELIKKTREIGIDAVEIAGGNQWWDGTNKRTVSLHADERKQLRATLEEHNVCAISLGGSQGTPEDFDFAKELGLKFLQGEPPVEQLVAVSRRAAEYGIRFALHNHATPTRYWDYRETLKRVADCDPALGLCPDTGHFIRSGFDPLDIVRAFKGRMVSIHLKDLDGTNPENDPEIRPRLRDVAWGTGKGQTEAVLKELLLQEFAGPVIIEYDHIYPDGNIGEVKQCADFFRKVIG